MVVTSMSGYRPLAMGSSLARPVFVLNGSVHGNILAILPTASLPRAVNSGSKAVFWPKADPPLLL